MTWLALASCLAWSVLLLGRGFFWLARDDDSEAPTLPPPLRWPSVTAVIPARDEAETIGETVHSLLAQDYPGSFRLVVVDDRSTDGTGDAARAAAARCACRAPRSGPPPSPRRAGRGSRERSRC